MSKTGRYILIAGIVCLGLGLRLWHLEWGLMNHLKFEPPAGSKPAGGWGVYVGRLHPDEGTFVGLTYGMLEARNPLAVRSFIYPPLHLTLTAGVAFVNKLLGGTATPLLIQLTGRLISVLSGAASIFVIYWLARRWGANAGAMAALLLAVAKSPVMYSKWANPDALMALLILLAVFFAARRLGQPSPSDYLLVGSCVALSMSAKYFGAFFLHLPLLMGACERWGRPLGLEATPTADPKDGRMAAKRILLAYAAFAVVAFLTLGIHALANRDAFMEFLGRGTTYVTQHSGRYGQMPGAMSFPSYFFTALPICLGWPLYLTGLAGLLVIALRRDPLGLWLVAAFLPFYVFLEAKHTTIERYALPLLPLFCLSAAFVFRVFQGAGWGRDGTDFPAGVQSASGGSACRSLEKGQPKGCTPELSVTLGWGRLGKSLAIVALVLVTLWAAGYSVAHLRELDFRRDTRYRAAAWVTESVPPGATMGVQSDVKLVQKWMVTPVCELTGFTLCAYEDKPQFAVVPEAAYETLRLYFRLTAQGYRYTQNDWAPLPTPSQDTLAAYDALLHEKGYRLVKTFEPPRAFFGFDTRLAFPPVNPVIRVYRKLTEGDA